MASKICLNGKWLMKEVGESAWIEANVPGSVVNDLINAGKAPDPFWRENEQIARELARKDYVYERSFEADPALFECDRVELVCYGLDTIAEVYLNDLAVAHEVLKENREIAEITDFRNMHKTWRLNIKKALKKGANKIRIILKSPLNYIDERSGNTEYNPTGCIRGNQYLRKAHCMFGWDWGPQIPDAGIWRDICIEAFTQARLDDVYITQKHTDGKAGLDIDIKYEFFRDSEGLEAECRVIGPDGAIAAAVPAFKVMQPIHSINGSCRSPGDMMHVGIPAPKLWWPNGYGAQPLYGIEIDLKSHGEVIDTYKCRIGLRTITVSRDKDEWGEEFAFKVNGVKIFAMGANYIPEDSIFARMSRERSERLVRDCANANFNMIRVWGGGIFPHDYLYDLCDEYGIIIWQDLMFACNVYERTSEFDGNIWYEVFDNMRRLRHHACLGIWCGNNEIETAWVEWDSFKSQGIKLQVDYVKIFEVLMPEAASLFDPNTFYWPSSPSSGGNFVSPNDENRGDVHYWDVWHKLKPFTDYRNYHFRFCSEFGFQSFPCLATVESFTLPEDRNIFSPVMEAHQKNGTANSRILSYLADNYRYPKDFDSLLYLSQLLQAEAIKYGVEHWRRNRGRCMGSIYWQLNDCWPVASWSSIDYFGRWKALHYKAKRFYAPLLASVNDNGTDIGVYVHNEGMEPVQGELIVRLRDRQFNILYEESVPVNIDALSAHKALKHDFKAMLSSGEQMRTRFMEYALNAGGRTVSNGTHIFVRPKQFEFIKPIYNVEAYKDDSRRNAIALKVTANTYVRDVEISLPGRDCMFSDNYFDIGSGDGFTLYLDKDDPRNRDISAAAFETKAKELLRLRSVADSF